MDFVNCKQLSTTLIYLIPFFQFPTPKRNFFFDWNENSKPIFFFKWEFKLNTKPNPPPQIPLAKYTLGLNKSNVMHQVWYTIKQVARSQDSNLKPFWQFTYNRAIIILPLYKHMLLWAIMMLNTQLHMLHSYMRSINRHNYVKRQTIPQLFLKLVNKQIHFHGFTFPKISYFSLISDQPIKIQNLYYTNLSYRSDLRKKK